MQNSKPQSAENALPRPTADSKPSAVMYMTAGDLDWEPSPEDLKFISERFKGKSV